MSSLPVACYDIFREFLLQYLDSQTLVELACVNPIFKDMVYSLPHDFDEPKRTFIHPYSVPERVVRLTNVFLRSQGRVILPNLTHLSCDLRHKYGDVDFNEQRRIMYVNGETTIHRSWYLWTVRWTFPSWQLPNLRVLTLRHVAMSDQLAQSLVACPLLETLHLDMTKGLSALPDIPSLRKLCMSHVRFIAPTSPTWMQNLTELHIAGGIDYLPMSVTRYGYVCSLTIPSTLASLKKLIISKLYSDEIYGFIGSKIPLVFTGALPQLEMLSIEEYSGLPDPQLVPNLRELYLNNTYNDVIDTYDSLEILYLKDPFPNDNAIPVVECQPNVNFMVFEQLIDESYEADEQPLTPQFNGTWESLRHVFYLDKDDDNDPFEVDAPHAEFHHMFGDGYQSELVHDYPRYTNFDATSFRADLFVDRSAQCHDRLVKRTTDAALADISALFNE